MEQNQSVLKTAEKVKAFAIVLIGAGIFSLGTTYFSEQSSYRIPRILLPVYDLFGNVGLAIGMILLGAGLAYFAFRNYKKNAGKIVYLLVFMAIAVLGFYGIIFAAKDKKMDRENIRAEIQNGQKEMQDKIANVEKPELSNEIANKYLEDVEALESKYERAVKETNRPLFDECEKEYDHLITAALGKVVQEISATAGYKDFAMYNAKVLQKIQVFREHKW